MIPGQDTDLYQRIGEILASVMPPRAQRISALATVGDDWSEVSFEFAGDDGKPAHFGFDAHPARAAGDIGEALIELRRRMAADGSDPWSHCRFDMNRDGKFDLDFDYAPIDD